MWTCRIKAAEHTGTTFLSPDVAINIEIADPAASKDESGDDHGPIYDSNSQMLWFEFNTITCTLLNELELFAMAVNSGVVDGDVLFPSLRQIFFGVTRTLYFYICSIHKVDITDRYYTHATTLYISWREKYKANQDKTKALDDGVNRGFQIKKRRML